MTNPSNQALQVALCILSDVPVEDGAGLKEFSGHYMAGWNAPAVGVNDSVGVLRTLVKRRAIRCIVDAIRPHPQPEQPKP